MTEKNKSTLPDRVEAALRDNPTVQLLNIQRQRYVRHFFPESSRNDPKKLPFHRVFESLHYAVLPVDLCFSFSGLNQWVESLLPENVSADQEITLFGLDTSERREYYACGVLDYVGQHDNYVRGVRLGGIKLTETIVKYRSRRKILEDFEIEFLDEGTAQRFKMDVGTNNLHREFGGEWKSPKIQKGTREIFISPYINEADFQKRLLGDGGEARRFRREGEPRDAFSSIRPLSYIYDVLDHEGKKEFEALVLETAEELTLKNGAETYYSLREGEKTRICLTVHALRIGWPPFSRENYGSDLCRRTY